MSTNFSQEKKDRLTRAPTEPLKTRCRPPPRWPEPWRCPAALITDTGPAIHAFAGTDIHIDCECQTWQPSLSSPSLPYCALPFSSFPPLRVLPLSLPPPPPLNPPRFSSTPPPFLSPYLPSPPVHLLSSPPLIPPLLFPSLCLPHFHPHIRH